MRKFLLTTALGIALTIVGAQEALAQRGYFALGGEMFILPAVYLALYGIPAAVRSIGELLLAIEREEKDEAKPEKISGDQKDGSCADGSLLRNRAAGRGPESTSRLSGSA